MANRRDGFPNPHNYFATRLRQPVHSVLPASCLHVMMTMPSLVLDMSTGKMLLHGSKNKKTSNQSHRAIPLTLFDRVDAKNRVDNQLVQQYKAEVVYVSTVLERVVAVIPFLAKRELPYRGHDEGLGSVHNGNFLGTLKLLAKFDPFIADHIEKHGKQGRESVSYLSSTICNELIDIMVGKCSDLSLMK